jgi:hypothetical protein
MRVVWVVRFAGIIVSCVVVGELVIGWLVRLLSFLPLYSIQMKKKRENRTLI